MTFPPAVPKSHGNWPKVKNPINQWADVSHCVQRLAVLRMWQNHLAVEGGSSREQGAGGEWGETDRWTDRQNEYDVFLLPCTPLLIVDKR